MKEVQIIKASKDKVIRSGVIIKNKIRVAPYARVSTDSDEQKNSYESQKKYYGELISNNDKDTKEISIVPEEAEIVRYIFKRYIEVLDLMRLLKN